MILHYCSSILSFRKLAGLLKSLFFVDVSTHGFHGDFTQFLKKKCFDIGSKWKGDSRTYA